MPIYIPLAPPRLHTEFNYNYNYNYSYNATQWNDPGQTTQFPDYDNDDEEEVVYDLDEHAMACLPHHLQQVMRELHMERLERLQRENPYFKFRSPVAYNRNSHANAWLDRVVSQLVDRRSMQRGGHRQFAETDDVLPQQMGWGENQTQAAAEPQHTLVDTVDQAPFMSRTLPQQIGWGQQTLGDTVDQAQVVSRNLGQKMGWGENQTQATAEPQHAIEDTVNQTQFAFRTPETELAYHHEETITDAGVETEHNSVPIQEYFAERDDKNQTRTRYATWYGGQTLEERFASPDIRKRRSSIMLEMRSRLQRKIGRMSRFFKRYSVP